MTVYFHGTHGKGALASPAADVVAPQWSTASGAVLQATEQSAGSYITAVAGYSLGRQPLVALLESAAAAYVETVILIDPLYDDGVTAAVGGRRHVLLVCSDDPRAAATCGPMASALGVEPCRFAGDHYALGSHIPDFLAWKRGGCPPATTGATRDATETENENETPPSNDDGAWPDASPAASESCRLE